MKNVEKGMADTMEAKIKFIETSNRDH